MKAPRRGFASVLVITLIIVVAVALAALGRHFSDDVKRTRAQAIDAQLRQLLTAGAAVAGNQLVAEGPSTTTSGSVPLPAELTDNGARLTIALSRVGGDRVDAIIVARLASHTMEQTVHFERQPGRWQPVAASLNSTRLAAADVR
jgi:hypothetical protein